MPGLSLNGGTLRSVPNNATAEQLVEVVNDLVDAFNAQNKIQYYTDGQNRRVVVGYLPGRFNNGANTGVAVSQPGYDVGNCDPSNLLFRT